MTRYCQRSCYCQRSSVDGHTCPEIAVAEVTSICVHEHIRVTLQCEKHVWLDNGICKVCWLHSTESHECVLRRLDCADLRVAS